MDEMVAMFRELLAHYSTQILFVVGLLSLFHWKRLVDSGKDILKFVRRLSLFAFVVAFFMPYIKITSAIKMVLIDNFNLNYNASQFLPNYKGTDWMDGILSATFFFFYVIWVVVLWAKEKKASKPPGEKPFKAEVKFGNLDPPKK